MRYHIIFLLLSVIVAGAMLAAEPAGAQGGSVTVYLRNISGDTAEYNISDTANPGGGWASVPNGGKTQFQIGFGQYFHYRHPGKAIKSVPVGPYEYVAAWWKFTPGPSDGGVTYAEGNITLLGGALYPLLQGDPEMSDPNVARQPANQGGQDVGGQIGVVWRSFGGPRSGLGEPTSGELEASVSPSGTTGRYRNFRGGQIVWNRKTGEAYALYGTIGALYISMGGTASALGFPRNNEMDITPSPFGTRGRWQPFETGIIVWHSNGANAGKAFAVWGAICNLYQSMGGTGSWLGLPVSHEYESGGGRRSDFEGGFIFWTAASGAKAYAHNIR
jgi:hypothetical protein